MGLSSYKITSSEIAQKGVVAAPDRLTGSAQQNKMVFDRLIREAVAELFNGLIDELTGEEGAGDIGLTEIDGVTGSDVQTALGSVKTILDTKSASADTAAALALKSDKSVTDLHVKSVSFNAQTGVFTFTREDGTYTAIDTALEKVATNWQYDAATQSLVLTLVDGTTQTVPLSAFITETEFTASDSVVFSVSNHVVSASVKSGSITDSMLSSALVAQLQGYVSDAASSATAAAQSASAAEGYKNAASQKASDAANSASAAAGSASAAGISADNAAGSADDAADSATAAATSASTANQKALDAEDSAEDSEAWAVGQRGGTDVPSSDETYHNNAKYWAGQAEQAAGGGVTSFNGRSGTVTPQSGDYTAAMVGAIPTTAKGAANGVAELDASGRVPSAQLPSYADKPKQVYVNLSATWSGTGPYTQTVTVSGATATSKIDLQPTAAQLQQLIDDGVQALYVENDGGTCTAVAVGAAPSVAMMMAAEVTEVVPPPYPLNTNTMTLGDDTVCFTAYPSIKWQVQHIDGDYVYLALATMTELIKFGSNTTYSGSTIAEKCTTFLNSTIPNVSSCLENVTASGVTAKVFIPEKTWYESDWDWPKASTSNRICKYNGSGYSYWTSSPGSSSLVWRVVDDGGFNLYGTSYSGGFRPAVKVKYK